MSATLASLIVVGCMLSAALAQSSSPPPPSSQNQSANAQPTAPSKGSVLQDGTAVTLRLGRSLSSADAHAGDRVDFEVAQEVSVNRIVVIPKDSPASGTVITAQKKRRMGRAGKLDVSIESVQLADGEKATLRAVKESQGGSHTGIMAGGMVATSLIVWPAAPVFLLMHGKDVTIPKGTEVTAYISGDVKLDLAKFQPAPVVPAAPRHPSCIAGPSGWGAIGGVLDSRWRRHRDRWKFRGQHTFHGGSCGRTAPALRKESRIQALGTQNHGVERTHQD